jgi:lipopolysaccharide assembly outer membrane protein LptD (OstA)
MKVFLTCLLLTLVYGTISAGHTNLDSSEFKPSGQPFALIYTNAHTQISESDNETAFEITRAYFGYEYDFSKHFSARINLDVADPGSGKLQHTAYLKHAYLKFTCNNLTSYFGMISTIQFKLQEKIWGHRYILKSFQDEYKFGTSADLGISVAYNITDMLIIDAIFMNGEGYKSVQADSTYRAGVGITVKPIKGLVLRSYVDYEKKDEALVNIATFLGYSKESISACVEYNIEANSDYKKDHNLSGFSAYASYRINKTLEVFGRYDYLTSNKLSGEQDMWNISNDGQMFMAGMEYAPVKGIKIAPNYKGWLPLGDEGELISWLYLSLEIKF